MNFDNPTFRRCQDFTEFPDTVVAGLLAVARMRLQIHMGGRGMAAAAFLQAVSTDNRGDFWLEPNKIGRAFDMFLTPEIAAAASVVAHARAPC